MIPTKKLEQGLLPLALPHYEIQITTSCLGAADGLSKQHIDFENAGGYQFIIGDGKLPNYKPEEIWETYYNFRLFEHLFCSLDYQYVVNPAYNADRGPVSIGSIRVHVEF